MTLSAAGVGAVGVVLAASIGLVGALIGHLFSRIAHLEQAQAEYRQEIRDLWDARRKDAVLIRRMGDHIDLLEKHINDGNPPPPPPRPEGL